jgi:acetolactate synthase-1/2/3 large subunit
MAENATTVAQAAAKMMKAYGAEHIFTIAGAPLNVLYHCQKDEGIQVVLGRSERSIMSMADGYARLKGKPTFGYVQFGVGASALPPVFAEAMWGFSPLIVLAGSTNTNTRERYEYQEVDALPMMRTATKWAASLPAPDRIADMMRSAVRAALSGVPGPAFLEIPANQWSAPLSREPAIFTDDGLERAGARRIPIDGNDVERLTGLLAKAKKPVILSGGETIVSEGWSELVAFAEATNIPVVTSVAGKGSIAESHPLAVGVLGRYSRKVANDLVAKADFVLAVGTQLSAMTTDTFNFPAPGTTLAHVAIDPLTLGRTYREAVSVNADPKLTFIALTAAARQAKIDGKAWTDWTKGAQQMVRDWRTKYAGMAEKKMVNGRLNPVFVMSELNRHVKGDDLVIGDTGNATRWAGALVDTKEAGRTYQRAAGSLGWAFPGGLGAKLAVGKKRRVFTVIGDGGIGYHIGDIETALRVDTPAITIVLNNASFAGYRKLLRVNMGREVELPPEVCTFQDTDFGNVAKAYGAFGERVESPDEFLPALRRAEESGKPAIIDVASTPDARAPGGGPDSEL